MNEQYTADLFSEQLDRVLVGQDPVLASEFGDLEELLSLGEQMSQVNFQPNDAMQPAHRSQ